MSFDPNKQILPLVILLGHESQGLHNQHFVIFTHNMQIHMVA
jgi:hypothetical protein